MVMQEQAQVKYCYYQRFRQTTILAPSGGEKYGSTVFSCGKSVASDLLLLRIWEYFISMDQWQNSILGFQLWTSNLDRNIWGEVRAHDSLINYLYILQLELMTWAVAVQRWSSEWHLPAVLEQWAPGGKYPTSEVRNVAQGDTPRTRSEKS